MASIFDDFQPKTVTNELGNTGYHFYDADTLYDKEGKGYRLQGVDALEVAQPHKKGEVGGELSTEQAVKLANDLGYTNIVKTGQMDSTGNREMVDLQDAQGRSFRRQLAASGAATPDYRFDPGHTLSDSAAFRRAMRETTGYEPDEFDKASDELKTFIDDNRIYEKQFDKGRALERTDVDADGNAKNSYGTAWNTGMTGVTESMWGIASLLGEKLGIEDLEIAGEAGVRRARARIGDQGHILTDYKDVDGFGKAVDYVAHNALMSLPYMGITAASTFFGPAGLLAPAAVYTGQAWNEMGDHIKENGKERSASIAIATGVAQGALDRLGLAGVINKAAPKKMYNDAVSELVKQGMSKEAAKEAVASATKRELAELTGDIGKVAREQLQAKNLTVQTLSRMKTGIMTEGSTEAMQEAIASIGADLGSGSEIDWIDTRDRAIQGAVAGSALGGAFTVPGSIQDAGQWAHLAWGADRADPALASKSGQYSEEERASLGYVPTIQELAAQNREAGEPLEQLSDRADRHRQRKRGRTATETIGDAMASLPALWRGSTRWIFSPELQAQSRSARILADMFGGNLQRIFGGSNYENAKHHRVTMYKNSVPIAQNVYVELNDGKPTTRKDKERISDQVYTLTQNAIDKDGNFNPDLIPEDTPNRGTIIQLATQIDALSNQMFKDQQKYNPELGYVKGYLFKYKALNPASVKKNRSVFVQALKDEYGLSEADANAITNNILDQNQDIDEAFSVVKGGPTPKSHKRRSLGLSENPKFQEFVEKDLYANLSQAAKTAARYVANQEFVGNNAEHIGKLLDGMQRDGVPQDIVDKVAAQMQDYLDAESGNYKRPTSEFGKTMQAVQKNFMLVTTMAGLPLATISSFVEAALTMRGLTNAEIFGKQGGLSHLGKELADTLWTGAKEVGDFANKATVKVGKGNKVTHSTPGKAALQEAGYYDWDVGAATTTGVSETNAWHQRFMEFYFKAIGLQGWTNYTRSVRAAIAGDYINNKVSTIIGADPEAPKTNEVQEAEEALRNLGLDVSRFPQMVMNAQLTGEMDPETEAFLAEQMREAMFNFVNEAVALPQAQNRPLIYQDPRFALFTQFQGFMSTFTANHIPRLWGEYIKRGSPAMRYNTFALMSTMIALGFASQYLKDLIKYGETTPYLDQSELVQRGIRASGLLGTGERVLDQFFPLYEQRSGDAGEWLWNTTTGESPTLSTAKRLGGAGADLLEGDVGGAAKNIAKSTPFLGPFNQATSGIGDAFKAWNFDGS